MATVPVSQGKLEDEAALWKEAWSTGGIPVPGVPRPALVLCSQVLALLLVLWATSVFPMHPFPAELVSAGFLSLEAQNR